MVGHQTKAMDTVSEAFDSFLEEQIEAGTILVIEENRLAVITTENNVIQCSWTDNSWFPSHNLTLSHISQLCKPDPKFIIFHNFASLTPSLPKPDPKFIDAAQRVGRSSRVMDSDL
jgi:hypothetical protein